MKHTITSLIILLTASAGFAQLRQPMIPSNCTAPDSIVRLYAEDAARMAFAIRQERDSSFIDSVYIPQDLQDSLLRTLLAVYNSGLFAANAVSGRVHFDEPYNNVNGTFFIHENLYSLRKIYIDVDTAILWEKNMSESNPTGNIQVDSFLKAFNLVVDSVSSLHGQFPRVWMKTPVFENTKPIADQWNRITNNDPIARQDNYFYFYEGDDHIKAKFNDSGITVTYTAAWDDCPSGCLHHYSWIFTIFPDCSVQFISSSGDDLGLDVHSQEDPVFSATTIYPNPAEQKISFQVSTPCEIEIIDEKGNRIKKFNRASGQGELDISEFSKGIYFLNTKDQYGNTHSVKFIRN